MAKRLNIYSLKLVKEDSVLYEIEKRKISGPSDIVRIGRDFLSLCDEPEEVLTLFTLDTKMNLTGVFEVSRGSLNNTIVHPREVFKRAIVNNAAAIILVHNHPSNDCSPSSEDVQITNRISEVGEVIGINLIDHIVLGESSYKSLKETGVF